MSFYNDYLSAVPGWYADKEFSSDWTSLHIPIWIAVLRSFRDRPCDVLEIGSWEGRSAVFFLEFLLHCRLTCIDTFGGGAENHASPVESGQIPLIERRFDSNLKAYVPRFEKLKARSITALDALSQAGASFDIIYVDGSHMRDDVMVDSILAWRMVRSGGLLIWDDYAGGVGKPSPERVCPAVDSFLAWHMGEFIELHRGYQVIVQRRTPAQSWLPSVEDAAPAQAERDHVDGQSRVAANAAIS
jgi:hypothetical protein